MDYTQITRLVEQSLTTYRTGSIQLDSEDLTHLFHELLVSLSRLPASTISSSLQSRLNDLVAIGSLFPNSEAYENIIHVATFTSIPMGLGVVSNVYEAHLRSLISDSEFHWSSRSKVLPEGSEITSLPFERRVWSVTFSRAIANILYKTPKMRELLWNWLKERDASVQLGIQSLAITLIALIDSSTTASLSALYETSEDSGDHLLSYFSAIGNALFNDKHVQGKCMELFKCIALMWSRFPSHRIRFTPILLKAFKAMTADVIHPETLELGLSFLLYKDEESEKLVQAINDLSLQWSVRLLSDKSILVKEGHNLLEQSGEYLSLIRSDLTKRSPSGTYQAARHCDGTLSGTCPCCCITEPSNGLLCYAFLWDCHGVYFS